jgi:TRAP-type C4-dicarboxylate transport system permease small subunit
MRKLLFFVFATIFALGALSIKGTTGYAVADVSMGNFGISMIGLIVLAFVFALFTFTNNKETSVKKADVWDELEEAEEEWQKKRKRGK